MMEKKFIKTFVVAASFFLFGSQQIFADTSASVNSPLAKVFVSPQDVQTSCYWYWISGNVSKEGVVNDIKSMKRAGINRAFIGFQGIEEVPRGPVYIQTDKWYDIVHAALKAATEENIEIGIFNSPGWSQAGGPWISPNQSMRYLASQQALVNGGENKTITFPHPENFLQNVKVLAYKRNNTNTSIVPSEIVSEGIVDISNMFDGNPNTVSGFTSDHVSIVFKPAKKDFTLRSIKLESATPIRAAFFVKVKREGKWVDVASFGADRTNMMIEVGYDRLAPIAAAIPDVKGEEFMLDIRINSNCKLKELSISEDPIVDQYADQILSKMHQTPQPLWTDYKWSSPANYTSSEVIAENDVIDITKYLNNDVLTWDFPKGNWEVVRLYMAPTTICNSPALEGDGKGLEVDRWNKESLKHHYDSFIGAIMRRVPAEDRKTWKVIVCDSYERATQNYGDDFIQYFKTKYGYDPTPYLLTYNGTVVGSAEKSDRFLWDLRRAIADRLAYDHIGGMRTLANKDGFGIWLEPYGHWGFPGEFLQYGGQSDEVSGEFWSEGSLGDIENRAASSVAHIYGKGKVSSESFTCGGSEFARSPRNMKQRGDKFFTEGINSTLLHLYISQPDEASLPGQNCPFGNEFNRKNTWYNQLDLFTTYLKRCNYLLQQGNYVADIAYFIGEDAPVMIGITDPAPPKGFQYDFINAEVIERDLTANGNNILSLPHGTQYKLLVLPPSKTMRPAMIRKIKQLLEDGAIILGQKPEKSPSLQDYDSADAEVKAIANELWGSKNSEKSIRKIGKGALFTGYSIEDIFAMLDIQPDFSHNGDADIKYAHTSSKDRDIYFISNQTDKMVEFNGQFRMAGKAPEQWNPIDGSSHDVKSFVNVGNTTTIPVRLAPTESSFFIFEKGITDQPQALDMALNYPATTELVQLNKEWTLNLTTMFNETRKIKINELTDLSQSKDDFIKHFSGTANYTNNFNIKHIPAGERIVLDLGEVCEMAKVKINGKSVGGVWTAPYTIDVTDAVKTGKNTIEVSVVNNWLNRIVGDIKLPENERKTKYSFHTYNQDTPLQKSGLIGPVKIMVK